VTVSTPWNVNLHYDGTLDALVPSTARSVLDVGCGDGFLAARLSRRVSHVAALDVDQPVLDRVQARFADVLVTWLHGDVLAEVVTPPGGFDAVVSNATLHHLPDTRIGLQRLSALVRPGGVLAIVTFARTDWRELPWASVAFVARAVANRVRRKCEHSAPTAWPPADTFRQLRELAETELPGARVSRLIFGRVLIHWQPPASQVAA
jgi:2-polyprenyl-3-methyl-5-hydroxy-6-metoxy-1,4-benzoquinol methylase